MRYLFILFLFKLSFANSQVVCVANSNYKHLSELGAKNVKQPAAACFDYYYFSFYTAESGELSFPIESFTRHIDTLKGGIITLSFINAENELMRRGVYSVDVKYSNPTTITINYTIPGFAYYIVNQASKTPSDLKIKMTNKVKELKKT